MDDRRKYPRVNVTIFIKLKNETDADIKEGETIDISEGGICIKSKVKYSIGNIVTLQLFLGNRLVDVGGKVIWTRNSKENNYDVGIEFIEAKKEDLKEIKKYMEDI